MNLVQLLEESSGKFSWRKCLISKGASLSFRGLNKKSKRFAANLSKKLGVSRADKVAILLNNRPEFIISLFAILKTSAACIPLNVFLTLNEIKYILADSRAKVLIASTNVFPLGANFATEPNRNGRPPKGSAHSFFQSGNGPYIAPPSKETLSSSCLDVIE